MPLMVCIHMYMALIGFTVSEMFYKIEKVLLFALHLLTKQPIPTRFLNCHLCLLSAYVLSLY